MTSSSAQYIITCFTCSNCGYLCVLIFVQAFPFLLTSSALGICVSVFIGCQMTTWLGCCQLIGWLMSFTYNLTPSSTNLQPSISKWSSVILKLQIKIKILICNFKVHWLIDWFSIVCVALVSQDHGHNTRHYWFCTVRAGSTKGLPIFYGRKSVQIAPKTMCPKKNLRRHDAKVAKIMAAKSPQKVSQFTALLQSLWICPKGSWFLQIKI